MSKASAWAMREHRRYEVLEEAKARIQKELDAPSPDPPPSFKHTLNIFAEVTTWEGAPRLHFRNPLARAISMDPNEARELAQWILATFGEPTP